MVVWVLSSLHCSPSPRPVLNSAAWGPLTFCLFVYCLLCIFIAARGLSLVVTTWGHSPVALWWLLLLWSTDSRAHRLQYLQNMGFVALWHGKSSWTRDQSHVPCIGRGILNRWTSKKVPACCFLYQFYISTRPARDGACIPWVFTFWRLTEGRDEEKMGASSGFTRWCRAQQSKLEYVCESYGDVNSDSVAQVGQL